MGCSLGPMSACSDEEQKIKFLIVDSAVQEYFNIKYKTSLQLDTYVYVGGTIIATDLPIGGVLVKFEDHLDGLPIPKRWAIKVTKDSLGTINSYRNVIMKEAVGYITSETIPGVRSWGRHYEELPSHTNYTLIGLAQFKNIVKRIPVSPATKSDTKNDDQYIDRSRLIELRGMFDCDTWKSEINKLLKDNFDAVGPIHIHQELITKLYNEGTKDQIRATGVLNFDKSVYLDKDDFMYDTCGDLLIFVTSDGKAYSLGAKYTWELTEKDGIQFLTPKRK